ncbi:MAG: hypothetical protein AABX89_07445 [Candidatus Thermoplasmatota archaeon]
MVERIGAGTWTQKQLLDLSSDPRSTTQWTLHRLHALGIITQQRQGRYLVIRRAQAIPQPTFTNFIEPLHDLVLRHESATLHAEGVVA